MESSTDEKTPLSSSGITDPSDGRVSRVVLSFISFGAGAVVMFCVTKLFAIIPSNHISTASIPSLDPTKSCPYYSPVYPSEGGADCPTKCSPDTRSASTIYNFSGTNPDIDETFTKVADIISSFDTDGVTTTVFRDANLHITFGYYCCQTEDELDIIASVLNEFEWKPINVSFDFVTCAIDGPSDDHVSIILMLDEESNKRMMPIIENVERLIAKEAEKNDIDKPLLNVRRRRQEPFHATLALTSGSVYPIAEASVEINSQLEKFKIDTMPLTLVRPCEGQDIFCGP